MDENDIYQALGVDNTQADAEPEEAPTGETEDTDNEQEIIEPAAEEEIEPGEDNSKEQTKAERAKQAAARRQREKDEAVAEAVKAEKEKYDKQMADFFKKAGLVNTFDNDKPITSMEEFDAMQRAYEDDRLQRNLSEGKLTKEDIEAIAKGVQKETPAETMPDNGRQLVQDQISKIHEMDPDITELKDLVEMEHANEFRMYVEKGLNYVDAYKLAKGEKLAKIAAEKAKQEAMNLTNSKAHLSKTQQRGSGMEQVPADEMELYRQMMPNASTDEITEHYNRYLKKNR